jgi:hypothetical protein
MKEYIFMRIIYVAILIAISLKCIGIFMHRNNIIYTKILKINKKYIFDISNLFFQLSIALSSIVLILHANNIIDTINLK